MCGLTLFKIFSFFVCSKIPPKGAILSKKNAKPSSSPDLPRKREDKPKRRREISNDQGPRERRRDVICAHSRAITLQPHAFGHFYRLSPLPKTPRAIARDTFYLSPIPPPTPRDEKGNQRERVIPSARKKKGKRAFEIPRRTGCATLFACVFLLTDATETHLFVIWAIADIIIVCVCVWWYALSVRACGM